MRCMLFMLMLATYGLHATTQESFLRANQLYHNKDYERALTTYNQIASKSSATWFNMGNCYFYLKDYPRALWAWRHAQRAHPTAQIYAQAEKQIVQVKHLLGLATCTRSSFFDLIKRTPLVYIQLFFLLCWFSLMAAILWYCYCRKNKRLILLAGLMFLGAGAALWYAFKASNAVTAICNQNTTVRTGPHQKYPVIDTLKQGLEVVVKNQRNSWCKIEHESLIGWIDCSEALLVVS